MLVGDRIVSATSPAKKKSLQNRLRHGVVLCGEGYVFELERRGYVKSGPYVPEVVIDFPVAVQALHRQAVKLAKEVADETGALLAGNICNTWVYDPKDAKRSSLHVRRMYEEQVRWAVEGGAQFIVAEMLDWFAEA